MPMLGKTGGVLGPSFWPSVASPEMCERGQVGVNQFLGVKVAF